MWLVLAASGLEPAEMPPAIGEFEVPAGDAALSADAKLATARRILFDKTYSDNVASIMAPTAQFQRALDQRTNADDRVRRIGPWPSPARSWSCSRS